MFGNLFIRTEIVNRLKKDRNDYFSGTFSATDAWGRRKKGCVCPQFKFKQEQPFVQTELAAAQQKASHRHPRSPSELKPELFRLTCVFRLLQNSPKPTGVHSSQQKALTTRLAKHYLLLIEGKLCSLHAVFLTLIVKRLFLVEKVKFCHFFWS